MKKILIIAEKPSVTKALVGALEPGAKLKNGAYYGEEYIFTNAIGHLLGIKPPHELMGYEKGWSFEKLPIMVNPNNEIISNYKTNNMVKKQLSVVVDLIKDNNIISLINACDPDAEGEAIFREIYECAKCTKQVKRLILKDMTNNGILNQFKKLVDQSEYEGLRQRAYGRAIADYIIGMNGTQALTLQCGGGKLLTTGRVQAPVLKMIVDRYNHNKSHKKSFSYLVDISFDNYLLKNVNLKFESNLQAMEYKISQEVKTSLKRTSKKEKPPKLYDLANIQKWANKSLGLSAQDTLLLVQELYEKDKVVSYPRTDCQFINKETQEYLNDLLEIKTKDFVVGEVSAHYALIPLTKTYEGSGNKKAIYDEILAVTMANTYGELEYEEFSITFNEWKQNINILKEEGYTKVYPTKISFNEELTAEVIAHATDDVIQNDYELIVREVESKPKPLFTEATLISKMQNIGSDIEGEEDKLIYKDIEGIGTPATRGQIIKSLIDNDFIQQSKKSLVPTELGIKNISYLTNCNSKLIDISYTATIEKMLKDVEQNLNLAEFIEIINQVGNDLVEDIKKLELVEYEKKQVAKDIICKCPKCQGDVIKIKSKAGKTYFTCDEKECKIFIGDISGKTLTDYQINTLLTKRETGVIKGFISKKGSKYEAILYLNEEFEIKFKFPDK